MSRVAYGTFLRLRRRQLGLSQTAWGRRVGGATRDAVASWEAARRFPTPAWRDRIDRVDALGTPPEDDRHAVPLHALGRFDPRAATAATAALGWLCDDDGRVALFADRHHADRTCEHLAAVGVPDVAPVPVWHDLAVYLLAGRRGLTPTEAQRPDGSWLLDEGTAEEAAARIAAFILDHARAQGLLHAPELAGVRP